MVIRDIIQEEEFKFCPKCSSPVIRKTLQWSKHNWPQDYLSCGCCGKLYLLQLEPDHG